MRSILCLIKQKNMPLQDRNPSCYGMIRVCLYQLIIFPPAVAGILMTGKGCIVRPISSHTVLTTSAQSWSDSITRVHVGSILYCSSSLEEPRTITLPRSSLGMFSIDLRTSRASFWDVFLIAYKKRRLGILLSP